jgi:hypothetical protein
MSVRSCSYLVCGSCVGGDKSISKPNSGYGLAGWADLTQHPAISSPTPQSPAKGETPDLGQYSSMLLDRGNFRGGVLFMFYLSHDLKQFFTISDFWAQFESV